MEKAFFVKCPRMAADLRKPQPVDREHPYEVVKEIALTKMAYDNFITDIGVDRQFIEDGAALYAEGECMKCLLVYRRGSRDGILVVPDAPDRQAYVRLAAYVGERE